MPTKQAIKQRFETLDIIPEVKQEILKRLDLYSEELSEVQIQDFENFVEEIAVREEKVLEILDNYIAKVEQAFVVDDLKLENTLDQMAAKAEALKVKAQSLAA